MLLTFGMFVTDLAADYETANWQRQLVGDFDGNGTDDIANFSSFNGTWWISRSDGDGGFLPVELWDDFGTDSGWTSQIVGDFNNDQRDDIANFFPGNGTWHVSLSQVGNTFQTLQWADFGTDSGWTSQIVGDFNNDQRDDIANFFPGNGTWHVSLSQVGNTFQTLQWADFGTDSGWTSQIVGDFNGDQRDDIANFFPGNGTWHVSLSQPDNTFLTSQWDDFGTDSGWLAQAVGDFNADGRDDIFNFHPSNNSLWLSLAQADGRFNTVPGGTLETNRTWDVHLVGDFNGDGVDDVAHFENDRSLWWVTQGNGTSLDEEQTWNRYASPGSFWTNHLVGNFNGDELNGNEVVDLVSYSNFNGTWHATLAEDGRFFHEQNDLALGFFGPGGFNLDQFISGVDEPLTGVEALLYGFRTYAVQNPGQPNQQLVLISSEVVTDSYATLRSPSDTVANGPDEVADAFDGESANGAWLLGKFVFASPSQIELDAWSLRFFT